MPRITCIGDIMAEAIIQEELDSDYRRTLVLQDTETAIGGAVCNLVWYFSQLGRAATMIAHCGAGDRARVNELLSKANCLSSFIVEKPGMTDLLIVAVKLKVPAIYITGHLNACQVKQVVQQVPDESVLVFGGSRHETLRRSFLERASNLPNAKLVFSPSYSLYQHRREEILAFLNLSDITVVNENEAEYLQTLLGGDLNTIMRLPKSGGIVTRGSQGADLYPRALTRLHAPSVSGCKHDVIGAGEAFICGFLHSFIDGGTWAHAGEVGCAVAALVVQDGRVRANLDPSRLGAHRGK